MNHSFVSNPTDSNDICLKCKYPRISHTNEAQCDCCPNIGPVEIRYGNMLMCASCWQKEQSAQSDNMNESNQKARIDTLNTAIKASRELDDSIQLRTDIFNAETTSIVDLKSLIDNNPELPNKPYSLAEQLMGRFQNYTRVIFELEQQKAEINNRQKAIQVYLNNLANTLRIEEREKLKIQDINYKPGTVKTVKPKTITTAGQKAKKASKADIDKAAMELGIASFTLQAFVLQTGGDLESAVSKIKASLAAAKAGQ